MAQVLRFEPTPSNLDALDNLPPGEFQVPRENYRPTPRGPQPLEYDPPPSGQPPRTSPRPIQPLEYDPPRPSPGAPPSTPSSSGYRPTTPTASPPTTPSNTPTAPFAKPPGNLGRAAGGGILSAGFDFAGRLAGGQSVGHAAAGSLATGAGSFAGAAVGGFLGGPLGAFVGGYLGGQLAGGLFDRAFPPPSGDAEAPSTYTPRRDLPAGITLEFYSPNNQATVTFPNVVSWRIEEDRRFPFPYTIYFRRTFDTETEGNTYINPDTLRIIGPIPAERPSSEPNKDARRMPHSGSPAGAPYDPPTPNPAGNQPRGIPSNSGSGTIKAPGANPNANQGPASIPAAQPRAITIAGPGTGIASSPTNYPAPGAGAAPSPFTQAQPGPQNAGGNFSPSPFNVPAGAPAPGMGATPTPQNQILAPAPRTATISSSPQTGPTPQVPDAFRPPPTPQPEPPKQPEEPKTPTTDPEILRRLEGLEQLLMPLPGLIGQRPTTSQMQSAMCDLALPGNCFGRPLGSLQDSADRNEASSRRNEQRLDEINAGLNALDLAGIARLNGQMDDALRRLGPQAPGGLSGRITGLFDHISERFNKLWKQLGIDRLINILTLAAAIHNAAMLSRELGETLLDTLTSVLQAVQGWFPGFLSTPDGEPMDLDLQELFGEKLETFLKGILGAENYTELKASWIKANRILSTAANMLDAVRSMMNALVEGLQTVGSWVAKIGNGLESEGIVSERTWPWMDESPNFGRFSNLGRYTDQLENLEDAASSIQQLAEASVEFTQSATELTKESQELVKLLNQKGAVKEAEETQKSAASQSPEIANTDLLPKED